ncbi:MAG: hypothetical protein EON52_26715 [Actinomycetales bacterium]|nr:MAG: hypothetical protein EON52_26715 [Actinomycetales bacterium]
MTDSPKPRPKGRPSWWWWWALVSASPAWQLTTGLVHSSVWQVMFGLAYFSFLPALIALDRQQAQRRLER